MDAASTTTSESTKARLFLALACLWPLGFMVLWALSSGSSDGDANASSVSSPQRAMAVSTAAAAMSLKFRHVLDRVDLLGYGPTHPRVAVVIVGETADHLVLTLESVFANTDLDRIFLAVVVADGLAENEALVQTLKKIDKGTIPHWHGLQRDVHSSTDNEINNEQQQHQGQKVHVLFNEQRRGVGSSRRDAIEFIRILERSHVERGLKSEAEDLILLLLQAGAQLTVRACVLG
jgi:hypothetical protein